MDFRKTFEQESDFSGKTRSILVAVRIVVVRTFVGLWGKVRWGNRIVVKRCHLHTVGDLHLSGLYVNNQRNELPYRNHFVLVHTELLFAVHLVLADIDSLSMKLDNSIYVSIYTQYRLMEQLLRYNVLEPENLLNSIYCPSQLL